MVPLGVAILAPMIVNIVFFHLFLAPAGMGPAVVGAISVQQPLQHGIRQTRHSREESEIARFPGQPFEAGEKRLAIFGRKRPDRYFASVGRAMDAC
jgi:hypothetical protein